MSRIALTFIYDAVKERTYCIINVINYLICFYLSEGQSPALWFSQHSSESCLRSALYSVHLKKNAFVLKAIQLFE